MRELQTHLTFKCGFEAFFQNHCKSLRPLWPTLIHRDQVGFMFGWEARDNMSKTLHLISYVHQQHLPTCLLACDPEKAFDRVNWPFLGLRP